MLDHPGAAPEWGDVDDRVLYKGLRVRMDIHVGAPLLVRDPMSRRYEYVGVPVNLTAHITSLAHGGQVPAHSFLPFPHARVFVRQWTDALTSSCFAHTDPAFGQGIR